MWVCHTHPTSTGGHQDQSLSGPEEISARSGSQNFSYLVTSQSVGGHWSLVSPVDGAVDHRPVVEVTQIVHFLQEAELQAASLSIGMH